MEELLTRYKRDLVLRGYSPRTCLHYFSNVKQFLSFYQQPVEQLSEEEIKDYLFYLILDLKSYDSKVRQAHGAIKYFYTKTLSRPWEIKSIPQLKKKEKTAVRVNRG